MPRGPYFAELSAQLIYAPICRHVVKEAFYRGRRKARDVVQHGESGRAVEPVKLPQHSPVRTRVGLRVWISVPRPLPEDRAAKVEGVQSPDPVVINRQIVAEVTVDVSEKHIQRVNSGEDATQTADGHGRVRSGWRQQIGTRQNVVGHSDDATRSKNNITVQAFDRDRGRRLYSNRFGDVRSQPLAGPGRAAAVVRLDVIQRSVVCLGHSQAVGRRLRRRIFDQSLPWPEL